eukprot:3818720-Pleurochrysis_carterae.AAC.2
MADSMDAALASASRACRDCADRVDRSGQRCRGQCCISAQRSASPPKTMVQHSGASRARSGILGCPVLASVLCSGLDDPISSWSCGSEMKAARGAVGTAECDGSPRCKSARPASRGVPTPADSCSLDTAGWL